MSQASISKLETTTPTISLTTKIVTVGSWTIVRLPHEASIKLPSRGQVMVEGTFNGVPFHTPLEPDGQLSHWFRPDARLLGASGVAVGNTVTLAITPTKNWPEPTVPTDLQKALDADQEAHDLWVRVTPMARWEWIRWTRATGKAETRKRRIEVGISKLKNGERRPCCWNRNLCTEPGVSKNGILLNPEPV